MKPLAPTARNDLDLYERHAAHWWDPSHAAFRSLHSVNELRVSLVREWLGSELAGARVVDLGCGGGLMTAALRALGARPVGLDRSRGSLASAREHVAAPFVRADIAHTPLASGCADAVLLADVLEHVPQRSAVLAEAARLLRAGGACFVSTLNRTARARWLAVHVAEGVGLIPRGTHAPELFVTPDELRREAYDAGLALEHLQGERVCVWPTLRRRAIVLARGDDVSVAYSALLRKRAAGVRQGARPFTRVEGSA